MNEINKDTGPTLREEARAHKEIVPGWLTVFFVSLCIGLGRGGYLISTGNENILEIFSIFSLWTTAWVLLIIASTMISQSAPLINKKACEYRRLRIIRTYGERYK